MSYVKQNNDITYKYAISGGWLNTSSSNYSVRQCYSPFFNERPDLNDISLLVIHNISLPPNKFDNNYIEDFFMGKLDPLADPAFLSIYQMQVSAHCVIKRSGEILQFVSFLDRAWHAGVSSFQGRENCNDYSIGIELEGADHINYTVEQYRALVALTKVIMQAYPLITLDRITGHQFIAPERKTDPGESFCWQYYLNFLK